MLAKILIKRRFKHGKTKEIVTLLNQLRSGAMTQPGYISGITLIGHDDPENFLVIGTWQDIENWFAWKKSPNRKSLEAMLEIYQTEPTVYEEYHVGASFPD